VQRSVMTTAGEPGAGPREGSPLAALGPVEYARGHELFEARSDQRALITAWLGQHIAGRTGPLSVLSVGCGSGTVDVALADRAVRRPGAAAVTWTGVDPHRPNTVAFAAALDGLGHPQLDVKPCNATFESLDVTDRYDVVTFVHSLYYVPDVRAALVKALKLIAPGGELLILHAPLGALNQLTAALSPQTGGHPQWWSDTVSAALGRLPVTVESTGLPAHVDLTDAGAADPALLDFAVQATVPPGMRPWVLKKLAAAAVPDAGMLVPHPVTAFVVHPRLH